MMGNTQLLSVCVILIDFSGLNQEVVVASF